MKPQHVLVLISIMLLAAMGRSAESAQAPARWFKGNLHTHSLWSDGDHYPDMVVKWYKDQGYDFLSLTDHNILLRGEKWTEVDRGRNGRRAFEAYRAAWEPGWVETREVEGKLQARLKTLPELRARFDEPGRFLLVEGEEVSNSNGVHLNALNLVELIDPAKAADARGKLQQNLDDIGRQRSAAGLPIAAMVNHPNWRWGIRAEDMMALEGNFLLELSNGHPGIKNLGDGEHIGVERMWDLVLASRLERGLEPIYAAATDDAHNYHDFAPERVNPGRGWVMVRADQLQSHAIIEALEAGDFYASTGVTLEDVNFDGRRLNVRVAAEPQVNYRIVFIGTRRGYDSTPDGFGYPAGVGTVLAEAQGPEASYQLTGDELYVRARIESDKPRQNPAVTEEALQWAWTQPVRPGN